MASNIVSNVKSNGYWRLAESFSGNIEESNQPG